MKRKDLTPLMLEEIIQELRRLALSAVPTSFDEHRVLLNNAIIGFCAMILYPVI